MVIMLHNRPIPKTRLLRPVRLLTLRMGLLVRHLLLMRQVSSDRDGDALTYTWDFGDGNSESGESVSHAYDTEGEYEVVLMVSDGEASSTASLSVSVSVNQNPIAAFTSSATSGFLVLTVDFDASTTVDPEGHELSYDWDFGDGNTGEGVQVTHSFEQVGTFGVVLTVSDSYGGSATEKYHCGGVGRAGNLIY